MTYYNELINARRWEVVAAAQEAKSMHGLCLQLGTSYSMTRRALEELGIKRKWPRGRPQNRTAKHIARDAEIILLREQDPPETLQQIGDRFGISRERVRQILNARGRTDLCGEAWWRLVRQRHEAQLVEWTCANCGKAEKRRGKAVEAKTCSRRCFGEHKRPPLEETNYVLGPRILELREAGKTWDKIGQQLQLGRHAHTTFQRWAKRVGADISHLQRRPP